MNALDELKSILTQKTVTISRLAPLVQEVERMYIQTANKVTKQSKALDSITRQRNEAVTKAAKRLSMVQQHEDLKNNHHQLKKKYKELLKKQ